MTLLTSIVAFGYTHGTTNKLINQIFYENYVSLTGISPPFVAKYNDGLFLAFIEKAKITISPKHTLAATAAKGVLQKP